MYHDLIKMEFFFNHLYLLCFDGQLCKGGHFSSGDWELAVHDCVQLQIDKKQHQRSHVRFFTIQKYFLIKHFV